MNTEANGIKDNLQNLADDTRALLNATADATSEGMVEARNRLASALDAAKDYCSVAQQKAVNTAKAADKVVREHPYQAIGIAFGVGALVGFLLSRRD